MLLRLVHCVEVAVVVGDVMSELAGAVRGGDPFVLCAPIPVYGLLAIHLPPTRLRDCDVYFSWCHTLGFSIHSGGVLCIVTSRAF